MPEIPSGMAASELAVLGSDAEYLGEQFAHLAGQFRIEHLFGQRTFQGHTRFGLLQALAEHLEPDASQGRPAPDGS